MPTTTLAYGDLANQINEFMAGQANNQYVSNLPNYANMVGARTENIGQQLKGQLPQDVINQISQQAAERGVGNGMTGGPNTNSAYLRALGLNSLQMQQQGNQNLSAAINDTPVAPLFNPASMIVPNYFGQQELNSARAGQRQNNQNRGGGGITSTTFPALNLGRQNQPYQLDAMQAQANALSNSLFPGDRTSGGEVPLTTDQWWSTYGGGGGGGSQYSFEGGAGGGGGQWPTWEGSGGGGSYGGDYMTDYSGGQESGFWEDYE